MKKRKLGKTDLEITEIGYGTWGLGGVYYGEVEDNQGIESVKAYLDAGGNHLDSAYSYHKAEEIVGRAIKGYDRDKLVLSSKSYAGSFDMDRAKELPKECEISLRDLGTDYLDIYMIHGAPTQKDHMEALIDEFEKLKDQGKIRYIGASIPGPQVNDESVERALMHIQSGRIDMLEITYSIARQKLGKIFESAKTAGVGLVGRWVLESGMLSGKYAPGHEFVWPDTRNRYRPAERDAMLTVGQEIKEMLPEGYESAVQMAAAFALAEDAISGIILGGVKPEQVRQNMKIGELPPLPGDLVTRLKEMYADRNDEFNPTGEFEHVKSIRKPLDE
ncbi:MAG: aldo/keto reductase [Candidatus Sumerlaeia bacterium]